MKNIKNNDQNFWISYADLMAGLLFIFILLVGAIVIKYVFIQENFTKQNANFMKNKHILQQNENKIKTLTNKLLTSKETIKAIKILLKHEKDTNENLLQENQKLTKLNHEVNESLSKEQNRSEKLNFLLQNSQNELSLTKEELAKITEQMLQNSLAHQKLVQDLNLTKARIKNLTGIRIQAIKTLRNKLGKDIEVDSKSGAIRLPSGVLFGVGSHQIKPKAKIKLKTTLIKYVNTLLKDDKLRGYIDHIIIEGYTDTDGSYMYNLELSQKRALSVLDFLYSQKGIDKNLLQKYVSASGRSFSNIIKKNGKEDKEASRRIEVKFSISNKKAIKEIEKFLKSDYK